MILFPNCKINLGLHILDKREDGYHNLETVFYPVALQDALEIIQHPSPLTNVEYSSSGLPVDGNDSDNICIKAYQLLKADFPELPSIKLHLHKTIPMGAGLGGGSADGAFTLVLLNKKFNLNLSEDQLLQYALQLGSDCPFFIKNTPCYASGRGEVLEPLALDVSAYKLVIVNPGIHINTGWAFAQLRSDRARALLKQLIQLPVEQWKHQLTNDFEAPVFAAYPEVEAIKAKLYEHGAVYASMSGSGSTVYSFFPKEAELKLHFLQQYFVKII